MKKQSFLHFFWIIFFFSNCTYDPFEHSPTTDLNVTAAKKFFEENATDLQNVAFIPHLQTRSTSRNNLTPDWNSAETTGTGKIITIEIPLKGDAIRAAQTFHFGNKKNKCGFISGVTTKLVIQKHMESGVMRQFVVTLVDGISQLYRKDQERSYNSPINYFGYVIISSVTGEYLDAFRSVDGKWSRVFFQAGPPKDRENPDNVGVKLFDASSSPTSYQFGETSILCQKCYKENGYTTICLCCKHCNGSGCDYCMVTVTNCGRCHNPVEYCKCCSWCRNYPCTCPPESFCKVCWRDPCICDAYRCEHCGNPYCNGSCQGGTNPPVETCDDKKCPICQGCLTTRMTRGTSGCVPCDCYFQVKPSKEKVEFWEPYTLDILTNKPDKIREVIFQMRRAGSGATWWDVHKSASTSFARRARAPEKWEVRAEITFDNNVRRVTDSVFVCELFPTIDAIYGNNAVKSKTDELWANAKTFATNNPGEVLEYGCHIYLKITGDTYGYTFREVEGLPLTVTANNFVGTIELYKYSPQRCSDPYEVNMEFYVAHFHTHYPLTYVPKNIRIETGGRASDEDLKTTMPGLVYDYLGNLTPGHDINEPAKVFYYGFKRKTLVGDTPEPI